MFALAFLITYDSFNCFEHSPPPTKRTSALDSDIIFLLVTVLIYVMLFGRGLKTIEYPKYPMITEKGDKMQQGRGMLWRLNCSFSSRILLLYTAYSRQCTQDLCALDLLLQVLKNAVSEKYLKIYNVVNPGRCNPYYIFKEDSFFAKGYRCTVFSSSQVDVAITSWFSSITNKRIRFRNLYEIVQEAKQDNEQGILIRDVLERELGQQVVEGDITAKKIMRAFELKFSCKNAPERQGD